MSVIASHRCWAEVDLSALRENLAWIRHRVGPKVRIITVVKADAYGHGLKPIAGLLMQSGTDVFGVANLTEAQAIRSVGKGWPILMLGACLPGEVSAAARDDVMPTISNFEEAEAFSEAAMRLKKEVAAHVKVDTGMGRIGVRPEDALELLKQLHGLKGLIIDGIYTHFSSAEDNPQLCAQQLKTFGEVLRSLEREKIRIPQVHANNSGGLLFERKGMFNAVRPGLLVFGVIPPTQRRMTSTLKRHLRPALSWKCQVSLVKEISKGTSLSYGQTFTASKKMRVATVTAGYGDGYLRAGSNRAEVLIGGQRCKVLGRITMDQMIVDVSRVPLTRTGDEVVLIGKQRDDEITANELAQWFGTVPWEVLTAITYRVPRIYIGSQAA